MTSTVPKSWVPAKVTTLFFIRSKNKQVESGVPEPPPDPPPDPLPEPEPVPLPEPLPPETDLGIQKLRVVLFVKVPALERTESFTFEMINNELRIFPLPTKDFKLWIEYIVKEERSNPLKYPNGTVSDISKAKRLQTRPEQASAPR